MSNGFGELTLPVVVVGSGPTAGEVFVPRIRAGSLGIHGECQGEGK